jgi:hypothetical protein
MNNKYSKIIAERKGFETINDLRVMNPALIEVLKT